MQNQFGDTALIVCCQNGHLETAKLLVHRGAVVNYQRKVRLITPHSWEFGEESNLAVQWSAIQQPNFCVHGQKNCEFKNSGNA